MAERKIYSTEFDKMRVEELIEIAGCRSLGADRGKCQESD
jgi:hypothetical protein